MSTSQAYSDISSVNTNMSSQAKQDYDSELITLRWACSLTAFFFLVEIFGGYLAGSLAIMSDAAHLLSDLAGFAISLIAISLAKLPATATLTYGFARAEVIGAFVSIMFIWALTAVLIVFAIKRIFNPTPVNGPFMLVLGIIGLIINIFQGLVLGHSHFHSHDHDHDHHHEHNHSHSHNHEDPKYGSTDVENNFGHDHDHHDSPSHNHANEDHQVIDIPHLHIEETSHNHGEEDISTWKDIILGRNIEGFAANAAYIHVIGDALQNVGVIIAAIIITIFPHFSIVDPMCTLLFAVIVVLTTGKLLKETLLVLMEGTPPSVHLRDIWKELERLPGVERVGDLHAWSISRNQPALTVHLSVTEKTKGHDILQAAVRVLDSKFGIQHATIQINHIETEVCTPEVQLDTCFDGSED